MTDTREKQEKKSKRIVFRVKPELYHDLKARAARSERTMSEIIRESLREDGRPEKKN